MSTSYTRLVEDAQSTTLLARILERIRADVREVLGIAIAVQELEDPAERRTPVVLASWGVEADLLAAQTSGLGGPTADALAHQIPVVSPRLWSDDRWPQLTDAAMRSRSPRHAPAWSQLGGAACVPGTWADDAAVVVSCSLSRPADAGVVATLIGYEQLVAAALVTAAAQATHNMADVLAVLQSRPALEQAKGAVMGRCGCDADQAWSVLRQVSQRYNVKVREVAVALIEHIGRSPAEHPEVTAPIVVDHRARGAAEWLWSELLKAP